MSAPQSLPASDLDLDEIKSRLGCLSWPWRPSSMTWQVGDAKGSVVCLVSNEDATNQVFIAKAPERIAALVERLKSREVSESMMAAEVERLRAENHAIRIAVANSVPSTDEMMEASIRLAAERDALKASAEEQQEIARRAAQLWTDAIEENERLRAENEKLKANACEGHTPVVAEGGGKPKRHECSKCGLQLTVIYD